MKRLFALSLLVLFSYFGYSQCTPDTNQSELYTPTESEGLPPGDVTIPYEAVISLNVPTDTSYLQFNATVDSMVLMDVTGLPPSFSYECNPGSCSFPGGDFGCIVVSGLALDNSEAGSWDIEAEFIFYVKAPGFPSTTLPYTLAGYTIELDSVAVGIEEIDTKSLEFFVDPNPITKDAQLHFELPSDGIYNVKVYSLLGAEVANHSIRGMKGRNQFSLGEFSDRSGVYFVSVKQANYHRSMRFVVQ